MTQSPRLVELFARRKPLGNVSIIKAGCFEAGSIIVSGKLANRNEVLALSRRIPPSQANYVQHLGPDP